MKCSYEIVKDREQARCHDQMRITPKENFQIGVWADGVKDDNRFASKDWCYKAVQHEPRCKDKNDFSYGYRHHHGECFCLTKKACPRPYTHDWFRRWKRVCVEVKPADYDSLNEDVTDTYKPEKSSDAGKKKTSETSTEF